VLLERRAPGLLAGTWSLPDDGGRVAADGARPATIARRLARDAGVRAASVAYRGSVRHVFTHRDVTAEVFRVDAAAPGERTETRRWVPLGGLGALGVSSFTKKTVALGTGRKQDKRGFRS
jgi:adenine-specific DNA glycosylase